MTNDLTAKKCEPCEGGTSPLTTSQAEAYMEQTPAWQLITDDPHKINRDLQFKDFVEAMKFVNRVADVAEEEGHHPNIYISWNKVNLELYTHSIGGLSVNDFIMAAKIDALEGGGD